jgi:EmrB/QacA subfamily drug resistance transporter
MANVKPSSRRRQWLAFSAVALGTFCSVIDHGSISVALPSISEHFSANIPTTQWIVIVFSLTIVMLLLPMSRLGDTKGLTSIYRLGCVILVFATLTAGISPSLMVLIGARVVQGVGAAMTQGIGMAIVVSVFPQGERGKAIGLIMTTVGAGAIAGPAFGGILVDWFGWRAVFLGNVPLLSVSLILAIFAIGNISPGRRTSESAQQAFDWPGALLSSLAVLVIMMLATNFQRLASQPILLFVLILSGFVLIIAFIYRESRCNSPMFKLDLFTNGVFSWGVLSAFLMFVGSSGVLFLTPFYLQEVLLFSPKISGLTVVPGAFCMTILGVVSGRLSDKFGWGRFTLLGLCLSASGLWILSFLMVDSPLVHVISGLVLHSCGMGIFYSPNSSAILSASGQANQGLASGMVNLVRNSGSIVSVALATGVVTLSMAGMGFEPSLDAVRGAEIIGINEAFVTGLRWAYRTLGTLIVFSLFCSVLQIRQSQRTSD